MSWLSDLASSVIGALVAGLIAIEAGAWSPRLTENLLKAAVRRLPRRLRSRFGEEWAAHAAELPTDLSRFLFAIGVRLAAGKIMMNERSRVASARRRQTQRRRAARAGRKGRRSNLEWEPRAWVALARERIASVLPLDERAMQATFSRKPPLRVPFAALIESGMIEPGAVLTDAQGRWEARVVGDGSIELGGKHGSIHQMGAAAQSAPSCNGWTFWHVASSDQLVPLDSLRQKHVAALRASAGTVASDCPRWRR